MMPRYLLTLLAVVFAMLTTPVAAQDASEAPENPIRVTGTVRGPAGAAEGVQIMLELSDMRIRRQVAFLQARTDTEGFFEFDLSAHDMPRYGMQFNTVSIRFIETRKIVVRERTEFPVHIELEVQPGTVARGKVTDDQGNPIEDVTILAPGVRTQKSDRDGEWEAFGLFPGGTTLLFRKEGFSEQQLNVQSTGPEVLEGFTVVMPSATVFEAGVVDTFGSPVEYPVVYLQADDRYLMETGNKEGEVVFRGVPEKLDDVSLMAMAAGYLPTNHELTAEERDGFSATIEMRHGVFVEGIARLPAGSVAPGSIIVAGETFNNTVPQTVAGSGGEWRLGPFEPASEILLTILPPSPEPTWGIADLILRETGGGKYEGGVEMWPKGFSSDFTASFDGKTITMDRLDAGTGGFSGPVRYSASWDGQANRIEGSLQVVGFDQAGTFTMDRRFVTEGLGGEWELREEVAASGLNVAPRVTHFKTAILPVTMSMELSLDEGLSLSGVVQREDGTPFIDGTVQFSDWENSSVYRPVAEIGAGGRFELHRLPAGTFRLHAQSGNGERFAEPRLVRGGIEGVILKEGGEIEDDLDE